LVGHFVLADFVGQRDRPIPRLGRRNRSPKKLSFTQKTQKEQGLSGKGSIGVREDCDGMETNLAGTSLATYEHEFGFRRDA
jgi:hypothetical protein